MAACGSTPKPEVVATTPAARVVRIAGDKPPAELLRCPAPPAFDTRAGGSLPPSKRESLRSAMAYLDGVTVQARRLIEWFEPGKCAVGGEAVRP